MRLLFLLAVLLASPSVVFAQKASIDYADYVLHSARTTTNTGPSVPVDRSSTVTFDVLISGTATVDFKVSGAGSLGWNGLTCTASDSTSSVGSATASGLYTCNIAGANAVSAQLSACTACTVSVVARRTTATNGSGGAGGGGGGGLTGWPTVNGGDITFANSLATRVGIGNGTNLWAAYNDSIKGLQFNCVIAGVENDCNYTRQLASGKYFGITNNLGTDIFRVTNDTGRLSLVVVRDEAHFPVATCQNATASANYDLPTTNAPTATCDTGTNTQKGYLAFNDTTEQSFQDHMILPGGFVSMDIQLRWKGANTTNAARWCAQLIRVPDGATSDPAFPAQASGNCVNDTAKGTTLQENVATIPAVTCTSCVGGDHVYIRVSRMAADAADTFVGNALLLTYGRVLDRALQ